MRLLGLVHGIQFIFFERALEEVDRCLNTGGYFIHFQDIHPAEIPLILTESKKRTEKGLDSGVPCEFTVRIVSGIFPGHYIKSTYISKINSNDFGYVTLGDYLTKHLAKLFETAGFEIKVSDKIEKDVFVRNDELHNMTGTVGLGKENIFRYKGGIFESNYDQSVPKGYVRQCSSMDVLVARKK